MKNWLPLTAGLLLLAACQSPNSSAHLTPINTASGSQLAIRGYDPVAYHTEGRALVGRSSHEHPWNGATWRFDSAENQSLFAAAPESYAPQFGGYCAWAVSQDTLYDADPEVWKIVEGRLYLNYDQKVQANWEANQAQFIEEAHRNWPSLSPEGS